MGYQEATGFCKACDRQVMVRRKTANHILHFLITIVFGLLTSPFFFIGGFIWAGVWFLSSIRIGGWRCTACGRIAKRGDFTPENKKNPEYRQMWENMK